MNREGPKLPQLSEALKFPEKLSEIVWYSIRHSESQRDYIYVHSLVKYHLKTSLSLVHAGYVRMFGNPSFFDGQVTSTGQKHIR